MKGSLVMLKFAQPLVGVALLAFSLPIATVAAQEPRSSTTVVDTDRGSGTISRTVVRGDEGRSGSVVYQGDDGRTAARAFSRRYVRGDGLAATSTVTGPDGRTRSVDRAAARAGRGEVLRSREVTGPRGNERRERRWVRIRRPR